MGCDEQYDQECRPAADKALPKEYRPAAAKASPTRCEHCQMWSRINVIGDCRARAPMLVQKAGHDALSFAYPQTERDHWCGEFVRRRDS